MFTIEHLWIVKRGKGSKIMGAVEHSCWNCANIYKLVRRYFASSVSLNQPALLARFSFASFEEFLKCFAISDTIWLWFLENFSKCSGCPHFDLHSSCSIFTTFVQHPINEILGKKQCKTCIFWKYRWRILRQNFDFQERVTIMRHEHLINKPLNTASWGDTWRAAKKVLRPTFITNASLSGNAGEDSDKWIILES